MIIPALKEWMEGTFGTNMQHKSLATVGVIHIDLLGPRQMAKKSTVRQILMACFVSARSD